MSGTRMQKLEEGTQWRRKSDGQVVTIAAVHRHVGRPYVVHQGKRLVTTEIPGFLRKYEPLPVEAP